MSFTETKRLGKLLALTTSTFDGEALVAIRKANSLLHQEGFTWSELLENDAPKTTQAVSHVAHAKHLLREYNTALTPYERNFLTGIQDFQKLTEKQSAVLSGISDKVEGL